MLSSVLNSGRAIAVNIQIMRAFVRMRDILGSNRELARRFQQFALELLGVSPRCRKCRFSFEYDRRVINSISRGRIDVHELSR